jgi:hypothetical protein
MVGIPFVAGVGFALFLDIRSSVEGHPSSKRLSSYMSSGAEMSRAGATRVIWRRERDVLRQDCRDECDDLMFRVSPAKAAEVYGAKDVGWRPRLTPMPEPGL